MLPIKNPAIGGVDTELNVKALGSTRVCREFHRGEVSRGVVDALGMRSKHLLCTLKTTCLELFGFDQKEGVHGNHRQRLKPRCLFEIELRPQPGDQRF